MRDDSAHSMVSKEAASLEKKPEAKSGSFFGGIKRLFSFGASSNDKSYAAVKNLNMEGEDNHDEYI